MTRSAGADPIEELLDRAHAVGAERRVTNYGGGNVSCKVESTDPVTGRRLRQLWVKGSGGDLATLAGDGLACIDLDRVVSLKRRHDEGLDDDVIVTLIEHCRCGGAAPSIDTSMHALVPAMHVDHLHPDAVIALATAADGEALT